MRETFERRVAGEDAPQSDHLLCPECGYDLHLRVSERCPECGLALDFINSGTPLIPWEFPAGGGWVRAGARTAIATILRPRVFCRAVFAPVSLRAAQRYRALVIGTCVLWMLLGVAVLAVLWPAPIAALHSQLGTPMIGALVAGWLLCLIVLTGVPSYFFESRRLGPLQSERAVAISYYAYSPLLLSFLPLGLSVGALATQGQRGGWDIALVIGAFATAAIVMALLWNSVRRFHRYAAHSGVINWWLFLLLPLLWVILGGAALLLPPTMLFFLEVFVSSLQPAP